MAKNKFTGMLNRSKNITKIENKLLQKNEEIKLNLNPEELELNSPEITEITEISKEIRFYKNETNKILSKLSEVLYKAYKLLSNKKNGTFEKYIESEGLNRQFVYRLLKRYNLFLEYQDENIFEIAIKVIDVISRNKENISRETILKIINSENPLSELRELKLIQDKSKKENVINYEEIDYVSFVKDKIFSFENKKSQKDFIKKELETTKDTVKTLSEKLKLEKLKLKQLNEIKKEI